MADSGDLGFSEFSDMLSDLLSGFFHSKAGIFDLFHRFNVFYDLVVENNKIVSLVSMRNKREFFYRHFLDSLTPLSLLEIPSASSIVDVGSGAGLPGIPIKMVRDDVSLVSIDSNGKKASFQKLLVERLGITRLSIQNVRIEEAGIGEMRESFDFLVSRAASSIPVIIELSLPLIKIDSYALLFISFQQAINLSDSLFFSVLSLLGGKVEGVHKYKLHDDFPDNSLLVIKKISETPSKYPRRAGIPQKRPLF